MTLIDVKVRGSIKSLLNYLPMIVNQNVTSLQCKDSCKPGNGLLAAVFRVWMKQ